MKAHLLNIANGLGESINFFALVGCASGVMWAVVTAVEVVAAFVRGAL